MNYKFFIEYDDARLASISDQIYNLFLENNYDVTLLDNTISQSEKINLINNSSKKNFVLSNKINTTNANTLEIIYPLRSNDELARSLNDNLSNIVTVSKYYQLRAASNTALDYYEILRNPNAESIIIKYGTSTLTNSNIPSFIYRSITNYITSENIYTVSSGDSLYSIARKFNTTVDEIKRLNNLSINNLSIGQKLLIPSTNTTPSNPPDTPSNQNTYTVSSGDSLYSIARRFNTTVDEIKKLNNLTSNNLSIGQKLLIPSVNTTPSNPPDTPSNQNTYTVSSGDSLYAIARRFNTTVDEIKRLNNLTSNNLSIGQKLLIPGYTNNNNTYTVKSGDSLYALARRFNTSVDEIKKLNNLNNNNLSIGQKLFIPQ